MGKLIACSEASSIRIKPTDAPFDAKDRLKQRGYRWDGTGRVWWKELPGGEREAEQAGLLARIYASRGEPAIVEIGARDRYR